MGNAYMVSTMTCGKEYSSREVAMFATIQLVGETS